MRRRSRRAFVLLEVLVSLTVMGIALSMVLQSFTTSMRGAGRSARMTTATLLAREMLDMWELKPPPLGTTEGDFGEDYEEYRYRVVYEPIELDYRDISAIDEGRLAYLRRLSLDIYRERDGRTQRLLHVESALSAAERFTARARHENEIGFVE